jgi:hypothetical protein
MKRIESGCIALGFEKREGRSMTTQCSRIIEKSEKMHGQMRKDD